MIESAATPDSPVGQLTPDQSSPWTLTELQSMALANHPVIQEYATRVESFRGAIVQAGLQNNPAIGFDGQQLFSNGQAEQYGVSWQREFIHPDKIRFGRAVAERDLQIAEQRLRVIQQQLSNDVELLYWQTLWAQQQVQMAGEVVAIASRGEQISRDLWQAGEGIKTDVLQATIELQNARVLLITAENRLRASWQQLGALINSPQLTPGELAGTLEQTATLGDFSTQLTELLDNSPELSVALAEIERAKCNLARQSVEARPNLTVAGLLNWRDNGTGGDPNAGLAVSLPIPVRNWNQGAIAQAAQERLAAEQSLQKIELDLERRLAQSYEEYATAAQQVSIYREEILPAARESLSLAQEAYRAGEEGFLLVLTVQRTLVQTEFAYLQALAQLRTSETRIKGRLLTGALESR